MARVGRKRSSCFGTEIEKAVIAAKRSSRKATTYRSRRPDLTAIYGVDSYAV